MSVQSSSLSMEAKQLYAEVLHCIALEIFTPRQWLPEGGKGKGARSATGGRKGETRHDSFNGAFEVSHAALAAFPSVIVPSSSSTVIELNVDVDNIAAATLSAFPDRVPPFDEVLTAFIRIGRHYGNLTASRKWFKPDPDYLTAFQRLATAGYLGSLDGAYRWRDKARAAMVEAYEWPEDTTASYHEQDAELQLLWDTMPESFKREVFFGEAINTIKFAIAYSTCWLDGHCDLSKMQTGEGKTVLSGGGAYVCRLLVERFVKPMRPDL